MRAKSTPARVLAAVCILPGASKSPAERSLGACQQKFVSLRLLPRFCVCAEWHEFGAHGAAIIDRDKERVAMAQMTEDRRRQEWAKITAEAWRDASFKQQLLSEPNQVLGRYGMAFPSNYTVKIVEQGSGEAANTPPFQLSEGENGAYSVVMRLPAKPAELAEGELSDEQLEAVAGGDTTVYCCCSCCPCCSCCA
jgi:hypothetical protein